MLLALVSFGSQAAYADGYKIFGIGVNSCGAWTSDHRNPNSKKAIAEDAWLSGFITAVDAYGPSEFSARRATFNRMAEWIANYCHAHPRDSISRAAMALSHEIQRRERACRRDLC
ncbi:MAG: hypothetical protein WCF20_09835 [Methylovirgula sp.]